MQKIVDNIITHIYAISGIYLVFGSQVLGYFMISILIISSTMQVVAEYVRTKDKYKLK